MKYVRITTPAGPRRLPPRWMVAPIFWPEIELREQQEGYRITSPISELQWHPNSLEEE